MCGIVGLSMEARHPNAPLVITQMAGRIQHRGPDSAGAFQSDRGRAHIGFRRLAIRDLDSRADQPMISASGRTAIVFNGEVYNSDELAAKYLAAEDLRTTGDTEVVLETIERHGLDILPELNGMFAMAIVDLQSERMTLVRDRMGKKPLYLYEDDSFIAFGSELRSLKPFGLRPTPKHIELFAHFGYFPSPYTFFLDTTQVCPGEVVQLHAGKIVSRHYFHRFTDQLWSCDEVALDTLDEVLCESVRLRKLSDVPLGAFLSGGIDSALVAAYLGKNDTEKPPTFTVAFSDQAHNEATDAAVTANELSLPHREIKIQEHNLADLAMDYVDCYEQPYADSSGLVTMLLCRAVKQHVTVALSGDGGDEFFGGYARYSWFQKGLQAQRLPDFARKLAAIGVSRFDRKRGHRLARWLNARDPAELYAEILRNWNATDLNHLLDDSLVSNHELGAVQLVRDVFERTDGDSAAKAACFDANYYIPDDLQVKLDRASMQVALEVRCPLLDFRFANLGMSLNTESKYRDGLKTTLKRLLSRHVPDAILNRPKHGFSVPLARWLRGPMRSLVADTLGQRSFQEVNWLDIGIANRVWNEFLAGKRQNAHNVWMLFNISQHLKPTAVDPLFSSLREVHNRRNHAA